MIVLAIILTITGILAGILLYRTAPKPEKGTVQAAFIDDLAYWQDDEGWHKANVNPKTKAVNLSTKQDIDLDNASMHDLYCLSLALEAIQE